MANLTHFLKILSTPNSHHIQQRAVTTDPRISNLKKSAPNCRYYLQWAVKADWMGSISL
jgi:hypothetical protein